MLQSLEPVALARSEKPLGTIAVSLRWGARSSWGLVLKPVATFHLAGKKSSGCFNSDSWDGSKQSMNPPVESPGFA